MNPSINAEHQIIVQFSRSFVLPDEYPDVYATLRTGMYMGRTPNTPALAVAQHVVRNWNVCGTDESWDDAGYNWNRNLADSRKHHPRRINTYAVLDVFAVYGPASGKSALFFVLSDEPVFINMANPVVYSSIGNRSDARYRATSRDADGTDNTARQFAKLAAGDGASETAFRSDFFNRAMQPVDDVPDIFMANTTTPDDLVLTLNTPPRVGEDFIFDTSVARSTYTATVINPL